jgi:hypothetical protein
MLSQNSMFMNLKKHNLHGNSKITEALSIKIKKKIYQKLNKNLQ